MGSIKRMLEDKIPGVYVRSLMIGDSILKVMFMFWAVFQFIKEFINFTMNVMDLSSANSNEC